MNTHELTHALSAIRPEPGMEQRILKNLTTPVRRSVRTLRRTALALVAAVLLLTVGVVASNPEAWVISGSSSDAPDYTALPTAAQCMEDVGFAPRLTEKFDNGYTFREGFLVNNRLETKEGGPVSRFNSLHFTYSKDGDTLLYVIRRPIATDSTDAPVVAVVNDVELHYSSYTNQLVPEGYQLTEEDEAAQANGVVFSWGWSTVAVQEVQSLFWEQDGLRYCLQQTDSTLTPEELTGMAAALIAG